MAALCSGVDPSTAANVFWSSFFLSDDRQLLDQDTKAGTVVSACVHFLIVLMNEEDGICIPRVEEGGRLYNEKWLPSIRKKLLEGILLNVNAKYFDNFQNQQQSQSSSLSDKLNLPNLCLDLCHRSPCLVENVCDLLVKVKSIDREYFFTNLLNPSSLRMVLLLLKTTEIQKRVCHSSLSSSHFCIRFGFFLYRFLLTLQRKGF